MGRGLVTFATNLKVKPTLETYMRVCVYIFYILYTHTCTYIYVHKYIYTCTHRCMKQSQRAYFMQVVQRYGLAECGQVSVYTSVPLSSASREGMLRRDREKQHPQSLMPQGIFPPPPPASRPSCEQAFRDVINK